MDRHPIAGCLFYLWNDIAVDSEMPVATFNRAIAREIDQI